MRLAAPFVLLLTLLAACRSATNLVPETPLPTLVPLRVPSSPSPTVVAAAPAGQALLLENGVTWVYSYRPYQSLPDKPTSTITATFTITETVVKVESFPPYRTAQVRHTRGPVSAPPDWNDTESNPNFDFWYVIEGDRIYQSPQRPGKGGTSQLLLTLAFDLPLATGKTWCPQTPPPANPNCVSMGRRTVEEKGIYTAPAGRFEDCFQVAEDFNSGGVTRWFCPGVGIVAQKYDHSGSRFGFEQVLIKYLKGSEP